MAEEKEPFQVVIEKHGCEHCGCGRQWTVECPDGESVIGQSFDSEEDAQDAADLLNQGYYTGTKGA